MIPILGIPVLNRFDLLDRCLSSIDHAIGILAIVDNSCGKDPAIAEVIAKHQDKAQQVRVMTPFRNMGVGASWNAIVMQFPSERYWMICGSDVMFEAGTLEKVDAFAAANYQNYGIMHAHAANAFVLTEKAIRTVGLFDENIYPAYLEDCDYHYRCDLAGVQRVNIPDCAIVHGEAPLWGSATVNSDPELCRQNIRTHEGNRRYYVQKWGGREGEERFVNPNGSLWGVPYWEWSLDVRRGQLWNG